MLISTNRKEYAETCVLALVFFIIHIIELMVGIVNSDNTYVLLGYQCYITLTN